MLLLLTKKLSSGSRNAQSVCVVFRLSPFVRGSAAVVVQRRQKQVQKRWCTRNDSGGNGQTVRPPLPLPLSLPMLLLLLYNCRRTEVVVVVVVVLRNTAANNGSSSSRNSRKSENNSSEREKAFEE